MSETLDWNSYNKNERKCLVSKSMKISNGESLPDELWIKILEIGIEISILGCSDICSFSSCCKHFNKLSNDNTLWSLLLTLDYPQYKSILHQSYSYYNKRLYIRVMFGWIQDKLAEDENRLSSLTRKMKRIRFQMEILDMILNDEHSTSDLALFKERYRVYREKLDKLEDEHMDIEEVYLRLLAKYAKYNRGSLAISPKGLATDVLEDDTGASSNEDSEDSLGYESEESLEESSENGSEESSEDETEENSEDESGESSDDGSEESSEDGPD